MEAVARAAPTVVEEVEFDEIDEVLVISVRPRASERDRCPHCRRRCPGYDQGEGRRRWRALDLATALCFVEADAPRVNCRRHGVVVAAVPWARHDAGFTRSFEDQTAWLTVNASKTAVSELMRIAWRTVGWICARVAAEAQAQRDLFAGLTRLGIDEISVRKGQRYLIVVIDHDTGRLVWAHPGRDKTTVYKFLDLLAKTAVSRSSWCPATWPTGSRSRSASAARARRPAWTCSTSSTLHRRARRGPPRGLERHAQGRTARTGPGAERRPLRAVDEPRSGSPNDTGRSSPACRRSTRTCTAPTSSPTVADDLP